MSDPIPARLTRVEVDSRIPLERWGAAVKLARETRAMSQAVLADHVGVSQQTISKVELGTVVATDRTKVRIAHAIGMDPGHLFGWWPMDHESPSSGGSRHRPT